MNDLANECKLYFERKNDKDKEQMLKLIEINKSALKADFSYWAALIPIKAALEEVCFVSPLSRWGVNQFVDPDNDQFIELREYHRNISTLELLLNEALMEVRSEQYSGEIWERTEALIYSFHRSCKINDKNQISLAAWLTRCLSAHELAVEICNLELMLEPELGVARYVRCRANLALGDITNFEEEIALAMKTGADIPTCKNLISWYEVKIGNRESVGFQTDEIYSNKKLSSQLAEAREMIELERVHSEEYRLNLQERLKFLGLEYIKNPNSKILYEENKIISKLVRWPNEMISIWGNMPLFVNDEELNSTLKFREFCNPFNLVLTRADLLFYRGTIRKILGHPVPEIAKYFDANPTVWLHQIENKVLTRHQQTFQGSQFLLDLAAKSSTFKPKNSSGPKARPSTSSGLSFYDDF